jgi:hypothetical protein
VLSRSFWKWFAGFPNLKAARKELVQTWNVGDKGKFKADTFAA